MSDDFAKGAAGPSQVYNIGAGPLDVLQAGLVAGQSASPLPTQSPAWITGDYKVSAVAADHTDPSGGSWLICDGSGISGSFAALIALVGATRPDGRGRTMVMQGTNASVSTLLASDGQAVANRRPHHQTTNALTVNAGTLSVTGFSATPHIPGGGGTYNETTSPGGNPFTVSGSPALGGSVGTNNANDAVDTPSFLVPGNLFIHT